MVFWISHWRSFRCRFPLGNIYQTCLSPTRYANSCWNISSKLFRKIFYFEKQTNKHWFQLYFMVFPLTYSLSSLCYYRYQQQMNSQRSRLRIYFVYILFLYVLSLTLLWSFLMTVSYKYAWILSPFGLILPIYFLSLFVKCYRFKVLLKTNQTDEVSFKLLDQQSLKTL